MIELQTDADKALAAGAHEGVLKGSAGHMIIGSVSAEIYRRIEEHVRKAARGPDASRPEIAVATVMKSAPEQTTSIGTAGAISPATSRAVLTRRRPTSRTARRSRDPAGRRRSPGRLLEREARVRGLLARHRQADRARRVHARVVRHPGISGLQEPSAGHRRSPSRVPRLGQVTRNSVLAISMGRPSGRPFRFRALPDQARHPIPKLRRLKP